MEAEVKRLGPRAVFDFRFEKPRRRGEQTLLYPFTPALARLAVHYLRTPSRALWDLYTLNTDRLEPLFEQLRDCVRQETRPWLQNGRTISVEVQNVDAFAAGPLQVRGTVKNAIIEGAADRGLRLELDPVDPDLVFSVRSEDDGLLVSLDLAGQSLHLRGWRLDDARAALKETLAAQMLFLSRWDPRSEILLDPTAGTGTIVAEAALAAVGRRRWVEPRRPKLARILGQDDEEDLPDLFPGTEPAIVAHEIHTPNLPKMQDNLRRAGISESVVTLHGDLADLTLPRIEKSLQKAGRPVHPQGLIIANPPYGVRIGKDEAKLLALYEDLARLKKATGYRTALLAANPEVERIFGMPPRIKKPMNNGPIIASFLLYD